MSILQQMKVLYVEDDKEHQKELQIFLKRRLGKLILAQDGEEGLYRRSMYTIWKRTVPNPTISIFDAPTRDLCSTRRQKTNTPLQALVILNDPTYIEASRVLGKQITEAGDIKTGISNAFKKLY